MRTLPLLCCVLAMSCSSTEATVVSADDESQASAVSATTRTFKLEGKLPADGGNVKAVVDAVVAEAVAQLKSGQLERAIIEFPAGTWRFVADGGPALSITDLDAGQLVLRGVDAGTTLSFEDPMQYGIYLSRAHRVTVADLHLTRPGLFTTQGDVTGVDAGVVYFTLHKNFPDPRPLVDSPLAQDNDRTLIRFEGPNDDPRLAPNSVALKLCPGEGASRCPTPIIALEGGGFAALLERTDAGVPLEVGDRVALKAKAGRQTLRAETCDDLTVRDVRFTNQAAVSLSVQGASNRTVLRRVVIARSAPISGRVPFFAGGGGGPQVTAHHDGPLIEHCSITGTTDDAIAVFSFDSADPMRGARIEHNVIRDGQGRGINITQSRDGVAAHNVITRCQNASIQVKTNQTADDLGGSVVNWRIANNTFVQPWTDATVFITQENGITNALRHELIEVVDNVVEEASRNNPFLQVSHANTVKVMRNELRSFSARRDAQGTGLTRFALDEVPLVWVEDQSIVTGWSNETAPTTRPFALSRSGAPVDVTWGALSP